MRKFIAKNRDKFIGLNLINRILGFLIFFLVKHNKKLSNKLQLAGDVANYSDWLKVSFGNPRRFFYRHGLFSSLIKRELRHGTIVLEFGVARGYLTQWVLKRDSSGYIEVWHGFDTFQGLREPWRNYAIGAFSNYGETPLISDERIVWHVGYAEEQIKLVDLEAFNNKPLLLIFDLDLEKPTREIMTYLSTWIKPGDLIYFDEAFDLGERKVIIDQVLPQFEIEVIGTTPIAILFRVKGILA